MSSSTTSFTQQHTSELESLIEELEHDKPTSISQLEMISQGVANFEANKLLYMTSNGSEMDLSLISKLQRRIAALELEKKAAAMNNGGAVSPNSISSNSTTTSSKMSLASNPAATTGTAGGAHDNNNNHALVVVGHADVDGVSLIERLQQDKDYELIKAQELELENQKLRDDLTRFDTFFIILTSN